MIYHTHLYLLDIFICGVWFPGLFAGVGILVFGVEFRYEAHYNISTYGWAFWLGVASSPLLIFVGAGGACGAESARDAEEKAAVMRSKDTARTSVYRESALMGTKYPPGEYGMTRAAPGYGGPVSYTPPGRGGPPGYTGGYGYAADEVVDTAPRYGGGGEPGHRYANVPGDTGHQGSGHQRSGQQGSGQQGGVQHGVGQPGIQRYANVPTQQQQPDIHNVSRDRSFESGGFDMSNENKGVHFTDGPRVNDTSKA